MSKIKVPRARRFTLAKRDAAFDAITDAINDRALELDGYEAEKLTLALGVLTNLTGRCKR